MSPVSMRPRSGAARPEDVRPRGVHRAALAVLPRRPQPGIEARLRHIAVVRRRRGLRPVRELLLQGLGAHRRAPGLPGPHPARLPARRRDLPGRDRAGPGAAGAARPDRRLARRPRRRPARDPRRRRGPADPGVPPRGPRRAGHRPRIPGPKHATAQHPGRDLLECCSETGREDAVLRFTADTMTWPTHNISERGIRPNKTQQNISGRLTSEDTTQDRLDIPSYIDTARKHGQDALTVLRAIFTGNPWRPPAAGLSP